MLKEIVLITGTSSGFGFSTALTLAQNGYFVIATMRDLTKKSLLIDEAEKMKIKENLEVLQLDVTSESQIEEVKNYVQHQYGFVTILINNAGFSIGGMTELLDLDQWKKQMDTNLFGVIAITKVFLPSMRENQKGKIINLGSISGRVGFPGLGPYVTSKFALSGFSESLRLELLPFNINVSLIEAGSFKTEIWRKALSDIDLSHTSAYNQHLTNIYKMAITSADQAGDPTQVTKVILQICHSKRPKFRYQVGKGVKGTILLKSILPWFFLEQIIKRKLFRR